MAPYRVSKWKASMSPVLTPMSLRQSLNRPIQSLKVPIFATLPGIKPRFFTHRKKTLQAMSLRELLHVQPNCFQFGVVLDCVCSEFAAEAGSFVATEWQRGVHE